MKHKDVIYLFSKEILICPYSIELYEPVHWARKVQVRLKKRERKFLFLFKVALSHFMPLVSFYISILPENIRKPKVF